MDELEKVLTDKVEQLQLNMASMVVAGYSEKDIRKYEIHELAQAVREHLEKEGWVRMPTERPRCADQTCPCHKEPK